MGGEGKGNRVVPRVGKGGAPWMPRGGGALGWPSSAPSEPIRSPRAPRPREQYSNARGEGTLFNFTVCDAHGEIRITAFNADASRIYNAVQKGDVVTVRNGQVKPANPKFNPTSHTYEITAGSMTEVAVVSDPALTAAVPRSQPLNLVPLRDLPAILAGTVAGGNAHNTMAGAGGGNAGGDGGGAKVDVLGALLSVGDVVNFTARSGRDMVKRVVVIADDTACSVELTLWNDAAPSFAGAVGDVVGVKSARLTAWNGLSLATQFDGSGVVLHPDHPKAAQVRGRGWVVEGKGGGRERESWKGCGARTGDGVATLTSFRPLALRGLLPRLGPPRPISSHRLLRRARGAACRSKRGLTRAARRMSRT